MLIENNFYVIILPRTVALAKSPKPTNRINNKNQPKN